MRIGLTGLIGSGKTEVARVFASLGANVLSGDELGKEAIKTDSVLFYRLVNEFGRSILNKNGTLNRRALGKIAFSSSQLTEKLNRLVHPVLLRHLDARLEASGQAHHIVVDAALLVYWGYHKKMDATILVSSTRANRANRLRARGLSEEEIQQRSRSQLSESALRRAADIVIRNDKSLADLQRRARKLYLRLTEKG